MCAAQHGYAEIIECLVTHQAMALCEDKEGNIAVDMIKGSPKALKCLGEETLVCCLVLMEMLDLLLFSSFSLFCLLSECSSSKRKYYDTSKNAGSKN